MTTEQQRIAIAEACGWSRPCDLVAGTELARKWFPPGLSITTDSNDLRHLPNYLNDLNAMHEAEKVLGDKWMCYARKLLEITTGYDDNLPLGFLNGATLCDAVHATAAQRAEAFLKTLNLWKP